MKTRTEHPDAAIIAKLGGPAEVARLLNYPPEKGTQRVFNWTKRGIPPQVRLNNSGVFDREFQPIQEAA